MDRIPSSDADKRRYEEDIARLQRELEQRGGPSQSALIGGPQHGAPSHPPPPSIGHGPSNLFGGIMSGATAQGGPGLAPPQQEPSQPQGLPPHMPQGPPGLNPAPGPPQHAPFGGYGPVAGVNGQYLYFYGYPEFFKSMLKSDGIPGLRNNQLVSREFLILLLLLSKPSRLTSYSCRLWPARSATRCLSRSKQTPSRSRSSRARDASAQSGRALSWFTSSAASNTATRSTAEPANTPTAAGAAAARERR